MGFTRETTVEWVCVDCHLAVAGYSDEETGHPLPTPFAGDPTVVDVENGSPITECDTPECVEAVAAATTWSRDSDAETRALEMHAECDHDSFSLHPCAGCGSSLAGDRYAVTLELRREEEAPTE